MNDVKNMSRAHAISQWRDDSLFSTQHNQDNNRVDLGLTVLERSLQGPDLSPTENIEFNKDTHLF